jgi:hypothetical protein
MMPKRPIQRLLAPLAAAACALAPAAVRAQLPAPPVSAPAPVHLGGYASFTLRSPVSADSVARGGIDEAAAALLVSGTLGKLSYFGELQAASVSRQNYPGREDRRALDLARAYAEYAFADAARLRAGRFLTPIGQWNEAHAGPLTETAGRPLTTFRPFAKATTGVMLAGAFPIGPRDAGYAVWASPFDVHPGGEGEENTFVRAAGARVAVEVLPDVYLGASGAAFRAVRHAGEREPDDDAGVSGGGVDGWRGMDRWRLRREIETGEDSLGDDDREEDATARGLVGADLSWRFRGVQLLSEAVYLSRSDTLPAERGAFAEVSVPVLRGLRATGRYEVYDPVATRALRLWTAGVNFRPDPRLTLKVERQATSRVTRRAVDGWLFSLALHF